MRIDAHQHFWHYNAAEYGWIDESMAALRRDFLPAESAREMSAAGFDGCIAVQARQSDEETRWLLELAIAAPVRLPESSAGSISSKARIVVRHRLASYADDRKLVGIRHIVQAESDDRFLLRPQVLEGLSILAEFALPFDLLIYPRHLDVAVECVGRLPNVRFVLDHLAKPNIRDGEMTVWERGIRALAAHENVFAKLSGLITEADWHTWTPALNPSLPRRRVRGVWLAAADDRLGLAGVPRRRRLFAHVHLVLDYISARPLHEQAAVTRRQRRTILEVEA